MIYARLRSGLGIIAVEGKIHEPFGPLVADWNDGPGKARRLLHLCDVLGLDPAQAGPLRYQLFHRTASALFEAERWGASHAIMLVHSFSSADSSLSDFTAFAEALRTSGAGRNSLSDARSFGGVNLRLGWVGGHGGEIRPLC